MLELFPFLGLLVVLCLVLEKIYYRYVSALRSIPSPPSYPIVGHFPMLASREIVPLFEEWMSKYSRNGLLRLKPLFAPERLVVSHFEDIKKVLITESHKFCRPRVLLSTLISSGLFASDGKDHAWQRKLLHPTFSSISVSKFDELFERHALCLVEMWSKKIEDNNGKSPIIVEDDLSDLMMNIIGDAAFGFHFDCFSKKEDSVSMAFREVIKESFGVLPFLKAKFFGFFKPYDKYISGYDMNASRRIVSDTILKVIAHKRACMADRVPSEKQMRRPDILELMMALQDEDSGKKMSDEVLIMNVLTFIIAGLDTSSSCLTWTLYLLARHPEIQDRAREEVVKAMAEEISIKRRSVDKMPFIACILKESLRLYPPGPALAREVASPVTFDGVTVPAGYGILIPIIHLHHSKEYWSRPGDFLPDRFMGQGNEEQLKDKGFQFFPFSAGPRGCIGNKFAMLEMRIILALLLRKFKFSIRPDHPELRTKVVLTLNPEPSPEILVSLA